MTNSVLIDSETQQTLQLSSTRVMSHCHMKHCSVLIPVFVFHRPSIATSRLMVV